MTLGDSLNQAMYIGRLILLELICVFRQVDVPAPLGTAVCVSTAGASGSPMLKYKDDKFIVFGIIQCCYYDEEKGSCLQSVSGYMY